MTSDRDELRLLEERVRVHFTHRAEELNPATLRPARPPLPPPGAAGMSLLARMRASLGRTALPAAVGALVAAGVLGVTVLLPADDPEPVRPGHPGVVPGLPHVVPSQEPTGLAPPQTEEPRTESPAPAGPVPTLSPTPGPPPTSQEKPQVPVPPPAAPTQQRPPGLPTTVAPDPRLTGYPTPVPSLPSAKPSSSRAR